MARLSFDVLRCAAPIMVWCSALNDWLDLIAALVNHIEEAFAWGQLLVLAIMAIEAVSIRY